MDSRANKIGRFFRFVEPGAAASIRVHGRRRTAFSVIELEGRQLLAQISLPMTFGGIFYDVGPAPTRRSPIQSHRSRRITSGSRWTRRVSNSTPPP